MSVTISIVLFLSSRRRHTRYIGDWSSDVCSSDLHWSRSFEQGVGLDPPPILGHEPGPSFWLFPTPALTEPWADATAVRWDFSRSEERRVGKEGRLTWWRSTARKRII